MGELLVPVRTAYLEGPLLFVSAGKPDLLGSLALSEKGLVLCLGEDQWVEPWAGLERVQVRLRGTAIAEGPPALAVAWDVLRWVYSAIAVVAFLASFGVFGGSGWRRGGALDVTLLAKGRPEVFALTYGVPIEWPRRPTDLEKQWFVVVLDGVCASDARLDVPELSRLLDDVHDLQEFRDRWRDALIDAQR